MMEDAYLDTFMEDRMSGGDGWWIDDTEPPLDDFEDYDPEPLEDFGFLGDGGLYGGE